jgi:uncharacterized membrane protein (UPF0127 family)
MAQLRKNSQEVLFAKMTIADSFFLRVKGLLGKKDLTKDEALWIHKCNSIHTFGMKFALDCIFLDKNLVVKQLRKNIKPQRLVLPIWGADSVIECKSGTLDQFNLKPGDQLYVST